MKKTAVYGFFITAFMFFMGVGYCIGIWNTEQKLKKNKNTVLVVEGPGREFVIDTTNWVVVSTTLLPAKQGQPLFVPTQWGK
jgi:hypothetical protein